MASFQLYTDPLVTCPYNPAHRLKKSRMQIHLTKCKRSNPELEMKVCPFNAQHRVMPTEYQYHITNCPDRRLVERQIVHESDNHHGCVSVPAYDVQRDTEDECWDVNPNPVAGYDPMKKQDSNNNIFRHYTGVQKSRSERKDYYKTLFTNVGENGQTIETQGSEQVFSPTPAECKPLRKPKTDAEVLPVISSGATTGQSRGGARRKKIAANIFGAPSTDNESGPMEGLPAFVALGRGIGRGLAGLGRGRKPGSYGQYPPLAPGQVQLLE